MVFGGLTTRPHRNLSGAASGCVATAGRCGSSTPAWNSDATEEQACIAALEHCAADNPSVPKAKLYELATCQFINQARYVLLIGPPGVGKSHIAQSLGQEAIRRGHKVYCCIIFDLVQDLRYTANGSSQQNQKRSHPPQARQQSHHTRANPPFYNSTIRLNTKRSQGGAL